MHLDGNNRKIQLQRAATPRLIEGGPRSSRENSTANGIAALRLDEQPTEAYFVHEEEIPRSGVIVSQSFRRTRWYNGRVFVRLGVRKQTRRPKA